MPTRPSATPKRLLGIIVVLLLASLGACFGPEEPQSILDKGARFPDVEGVVSDVSFEAVTIQGKAFRIRKDVESFTTREHKITPLIHWKDRYVHVGLDDQSNVEWIAGIGVVTKTDPPVVFYSGTFERAEKGRAIFKDGTVLRLGEGVKPPRKGRKAVANIDPSTRRITKFE